MTTDRGDLPALLPIIHSYSHIRIVVITSGEYGCWLYNYYLRILIIRRRRRRRRICFSVAIVVVPIDSLKTLEPRAAPIKSSGVVLIARSAFHGALP